MRRTGMVLAAMLFLLARDARVRAQAPPGYPVGTPVTAFVGNTPPGPVFFPRCWFNRPAIPPVNPQYNGPVYGFNGAMTYYGAGLCRPRGVHTYYVPGTLAPPYPPVLVP